MNKALNGIPLPKEIHVEGMVHSAYNTKIAYELNQVVLRNGNNISGQIAKAELESLISKVRTWIVNHPGANINNITF